MKRKRGVIGVQFNWVFVLIVGALIIAFFVFMVQKQRAAAKSSLELDVKTKLQAILTTGQQSSSTLYTVTIPKTEIGFGCQEFFIGQQAIRLKWSFAPSLLKSSRNKLFISSADFNMPYKVVNFLYVTTPDVRYIFHEDSDGYAQKLFFDAKDPSMPDNITKDMITSCLDVEDANNYKVRFVFINEDPTTGPFRQCGRNIRRGEISAVSVIPRYHGLHGYGELKFYEWDSVAGEFSEIATSYYLGIPTVLGAIFTDSEEAYECSLDDAFERLGVVTEIIYARAEYLRDEFQGAECGSYYTDNDELEDLMNAIGIEDTEQRVSTIYSKVRNVHNYNKLLAAKSCPLLY